MQDVLKIVNLFQSLPGENSNKETLLMNQKANHSQYMANLLGEHVGLRLDDEADGAEFFLLGEQLFSFLSVFQ